MLGLWKRLFWADPSEDSSGSIEAFGKVVVARKLGDEILEAEPARRALVARLRDAIRCIHPGRRSGATGHGATRARAFARFALYVVDLPASKKDHHSGPFGLLDHSLEVASETAMGLTSPAFRISADPLVDYRERPAWIYAGVIAALGHDLGRRNFRLRQQHQHRDRDADHRLGRAAGGGEDQRERFRVGVLARA